MGDGYSISRQSPIFIIFYETLPCTTNMASFDILRHPVTILVTDSFAEQSRRKERDNGHNRKI